MVKSYSNGGNVYLPTILWYMPTTTPMTTMTTTLNSFIVLKNPQHQQDHAQQPNGLFPSNFKQRKSVHNGVSGGRWKLH